MRNRNRGARGVKEYSGSTREWRDDDEKDKQVSKVINSHSSTLLPVAIIFFFSIFRTIFQSRPSL